MSSNHKARYKNVGMDSQELRRRREEEGIQLRKQKREQQLFKKRNVNVPNVDADEFHEVRNFTEDLVSGGFLWQRMRCCCERVVFVVFMVK